jgi:predicted nucleic acid-binding protein
MVFIMRYMDQRLILGVGASIVLAELLVQPFRSNNQGLVNRYETILMNSHHFRLEPVTNAISRTAADLRAHYNLRTPDAIHIATAIDAGCEAFLTNDLGLKRVANLKILVVDELELP